MNYNAPNTFFFENNYNSQSINSIRVIIFLQYLAQFFLSPKLEKLDPFEFFFNYGRV